MRYFILAAVMAVTTGCATNSVMHSSKSVPDAQTYTYTIDRTEEMSVAGLDEFRQSLDAALGEAHLRVREGAADVPANVTIAIDNYYMRHGAARALVGIIAGRDNIRSTVTVRKADGEQVAHFEVESTNSTAWGTSSGLIEKHAQEIVDRLVSLKASQAAKGA
jgi:hypothetical protein